MNFDPTARVSPEKYNPVLSELLTFDLQSGVMAIRSSSRETPVWLLLQRHTALEAVELFLFNSLVFPKGRSGNLKGSSWGQEGPVQSKE